MQQVLTTWVVLKVKLVHRFLVPNALFWSCPTAHMTHSCLTITMKGRWCAVHRTKSPRMTKLSSLLKTWSVMFSTGPQLLCGEVPRLQKFNNCNCKLAEKMYVNNTDIYLIQYLHVNSYCSGRCEYSKKSTISRNTLRSTLPPVVLGWMFWTSENWSAFLKGDWICIYLHSMFSKKDTPKNLIFSICRNAQPASGMRHRAGTKHNFLRKSDLSTCSHPWSSMHHKQPYDFHIHAWSITAVYYDRFALHWNLSHGFTCDILIKAASFPSFFWRPLIGIFIFKGNGWDLHDPLRYDLLHIDFLESFHCLSEKSFTWSHQDLWDGKEFNAHS